MKAVMNVCPYEQFAQVGVEEELAVVMAAARR